MKPPFTVPEKQRLTQSKCKFKVKEKRKINREERDKRIGLSEEKIKELDRSGKAFFQAMMKEHGEYFKFWWEFRENTHLPIGFRFKPCSLNKNMWFLFTNHLEESLQDITDVEKEGSAMRGFLNFPWV